jgi:hypothetical protein
MRGRLFGLYAGARWYRTALRAGLACLGIALAQFASAQAIRVDEPVPAPETTAETPAPTLAPAPEPETAPAPTPVEPAIGSADKLLAQPETALPEPATKIDRIHDRAYLWMQRVLKSGDERFSPDKDAPIDVPLSPLRMGLAVQVLHRSAGWHLEGIPDFDANVELPNLKERYHLFLSSASLTESPSSSTQERNPLLAGLRVVPHEHVNFDLGVHLKLIPSLFTAVRWSPGYNLGRLQVFPFAKVYVETGVGAGASGGLTLERRWGRWIARSSTFTDWRRNEAATSWSQSVVAGYARAVIRQRRYDLVATGNDIACGIALGLTASGDHASYATAYEASLLWKRPLHGVWLYGYAGPVVRWERAHDWHPDAGVRIGIDMLFWGLATVPAKAAALCH